MATEVRGGGGEGEFNGRICSVCGGGFKNGKALGGHMRIHFPNESSVEGGYKKALKATHAVKFKFKKDQEKREVIGNQNPADSVNCHLCFKSFPSMKAIYGHMRTHPERLLRGYQPPPPSAAAAAAAGDDDDDDDLVDYSAAVGGGDSPSPSSQVVNSISPLVGWPSSFKRGRNPSAAPATSTATGQTSFMEDKKFREGVANLVHFSRAKIGDDSYINLDSDDGTDETHELKSSPESKTTTSSALAEFAGKFVSACKPNPVSVEEEIMNEEYTTSTSEDELGSKITKELKELNISDQRSDDQRGLTFKINISNQKKKMKLTADSDSSPRLDMPAAATSSKKSYSSMGESSNPVVKEFKCGFCPKVFSTHNGLGGHMSKHKNERIILTPSLIDQESSTSAATIEEENHPKSPPITHQKKRKEPEESGSGIIGSSHQCEICKRDFTSGQALGGHKKCHRPNPNYPAIEEPVMMREGAGSSANYHRDGNLGFDLNVMPPPEEEEDVAEVAACGGGSGIFCS